MAKKATVKKKAPKKAKDKAKDEGPKLLSETVFKITLSEYGNNSFSVEVASKGRSLGKLERLGLMTLVVQEVGQKSER